MSFTLFCPRQPWHSAPFAPSPVICHCIVILNTCIDPVVTSSNCFVDSEVYLIILSPMDVKGSSSPPSRVILMPNENKEHLHLTQATKSASISSIAQTGNAYFHLTQAAKSTSISSVARTNNASAYLSHSYGFLILEPLIIFLVIRIFFLPLLLNHLYP